ncbi:MAG: Cobalamin synthase [Syntrophus sp. PtaB.Bin001]|nr:MAG: Cobalamin synthase [Syntrophus sp. PtaB.Bin001]
MKRLLAALQFLTILPMPRRFYPDERALKGSLLFFPVVGLLIGAAVALADRGLGHLFPLWVTSVLAVILLIVASGALHIDGLADTADGFFSVRSRERILDIMKDSRTGPMGVVAIVCVVFLKIALLASVSGAWRWWVLVMMPIAGRCALLVHLALLSYARPEGGIADIFHAGCSRGYAFWALLFLFASGALMGGMPGLLAGVVACGISLFFAVFSFWKIGGFTGDTLGAACELTELGPALAVAALLHGAGA